MTALRAMPCTRVNILGTHARILVISFLQTLRSIDDFNALPQSQEEGRRLAMALPPRAPKSAQIDDSLDDGFMSGTFRWARGKKFIQLPAFPNCSDGSGVHAVDVTRGWKSYLQTRDASGTLVRLAQRESSLLDCLSFPVTIAFWLQRLQLPRSGRAIHIVVWGATSKAETRILLETKCFHELGHLFPSLSLTLWLTGPEVVETHTILPESSSPQNKFPLPANMTVHMVHTDPPCVGALLAAHPEWTAANSLHVVYNGGFGSFFHTGDARLCWSWLPDLCALADSGIATLFTCANDFNDVQGESRVQVALVAATFVTAPMPNPFHAGSHFVDEAAGSEWFCANHSMYVVQGAAGRRRAVPESDAARRTLIEELRKSAPVDFAAHKHLLRPFSFSFSSLGAGLDAPPTPPRKAAQSDLSGALKELASQFEAEFAALDAVNEYGGESGRVGNAVDARCSQGQAVQVQQVEADGELAITVRMAWAATTRDFELELSDDWLRIIRLANEGGGTRSVEVDQALLQCIHSESISAKFSAKTRRLRVVAPLK